MPVPFHRHGIGYSLICAGRVAQTAEQLADERQMAGWTATSSSAPTAPGITL